MGALHRKFAFDCDPEKDIRRPRHTRPTPPLTTARAFVRTQILGRPKTADHVVTGRESAVCHETRSKKGPGCQAAKPSASVESRLREDTCCCRVGVFAHPVPDFLEPNAWICTVSRLMNPSPSPTLSRLWLIGSFVTLVYRVRKALATDQSLTCEFTIRLALTRSGCPVVDRRDHRK